jgi:hypothetical protein
MVDEHPRFTSAWEYPECEARIELVAHVVAIGAGWLGLDPFIGESFIDERHFGVGVVAQISGANF